MNKEELVANLGTIARSGSKVSVLSSQINYSLHHHHICFSKTLMNENHKRLKESNH